MAARTRTWCNNTSCPAAISCALHWSRSSHYIARRTGQRKAPRMHDPKLGFCDDYKCDVPRAWLLSPHEVGQLQAATALLLMIVRLVIADRTAVACHPDP